MDAILDFLIRLPGIPTDHLVALVAVMALGIAGFAIHAVLKLALRKEQK